MESRHQLIEKKQKSQYKMRLPPKSWLLEDISTTTYFDTTPRDTDENVNYNMDFSMHLTNFQIKIKKKILQRRPLATVYSSIIRNNYIIKTISLRAFQV